MRLTPLFMLFLLIIFILRVDALSKRVTELEQADTWYNTVTMDKDMFRLYGMEGTGYAYKDQRWPVYNPVYMHTDAFADLQHSQRRDIIHVRDVVNSLEEANRAVH